MSRESIKIINAALDEVEGREIILRGTVSPDSLVRLKVDTYQRETLPLTHIKQLVRAFEAGSSIPDIVLGMRGGDFQERDGAFYLRDDVFIVDGLQRTQAAIQYMHDKGGVPRLGAAIHFGTSFEWERRLFQLLNGSLRVKLSPNVLLRNYSHDHEVVALLHSLTTDDRTCVMRDRVCWKQRMDRQHLISAMTFLKVVAVLHSHVALGGKNCALDDLITAAEKMSAKIGPSVFGSNTRAFFALVDDCWGIKSVHFKEGCSYMRLTFLSTLAALFSRHEDFWKGEKLQVDVDLKRKIKGFPLTDPTVRNLTAASGKAKVMLYQLLVDHVNSGKRTKRLTLRAEFKQAQAEEEAAIEAEAPAEAEEEEVAT